MGTQVREPLTLPPTVSVNRKLEAELRSEHLPPWGLTQPWEWRGWSPAASQVPGPLLVGQTGTGATFPLGCPLGKGHAARARPVLSMTPTLRAQQWLIRLLHAWRQGARGPHYLLRLGPRWAVLLPRCLVPTCPEGWAGVTDGPLLRHTMQERLQTGGQGWDAHGQQLTQHGEVVVPATTGDALTAHGRLA